MKAFMTNGTLDVLKSIAKKHPDIDFYYMNSDTSSLAYYEDKARNVFSSGRAYEVLITKGEIQEEGYIVMNNIPVTDEGQPIFEDRFKQRQDEVDAMPGFKAFSLLSPLDGITYVVFIQLTYEKDFTILNNSIQFTDKLSFKTP